MKKFSVVKKQGLVDESGKVIIPIEYRRIDNLRDGVFIAKLSCTKIHDDFLTETEKNEKYHIYTEKGKVDFDDNILDYMYDKNRKLTAVQTEGGWQLVSIDYEKNSIEVFCSNATSVLAVSTTHIAVEEMCNGVKKIAVYSLTEKKKIVESEQADEIRLEKRGFVLRRKSKNVKAFFDFSGNMLLDYKWDSIVCEENYIKVKRSIREAESKTFYYGIFAYDGGVIVSADCLSIRAVKVRLELEEFEIFQAEKLIGDSREKALIDLAGNEILPFDTYDNFLFITDNCVIIEVRRGESKKEMLCKFEYFGGSLIIYKIINADRIFVMHNNKSLIKVRLDDKYGVYDCFCNELVAIKYRKVNWKEGTDYITALNFNGKEEKIPVKIPSTKC